MKFRKNVLILISLLSSLILVRIGEYCLDRYLGNGDGYITSPFLSFWLSLIYVSGFLSLLILFTRTFRFTEKSVCWHLLIVLLLSLGVWMIFFPAAMSPDSLEQYRQAMIREFHDWHPPLMAIILSGIMRSGGDIGTLMFFQCISGGLGVYYLARSIAGILIRDARLSSWIGVLTCCILLYPWSPLAHYMMTFWKDTWCGIFFLWCFTLMIILYYRGKKYSTIRFYGLYSSFLISTILAILTRHNAIVVLPLMVLISWSILYYCRKIGFFRASALSLLLVIGCMGAHKGQYFVFHVEQTHPGQQVLTLDLAGMIVYRPELRQHLTYTAQHLQEQYAKEYRYGDIVPLYKHVIDSSFRYNDDLVREYAYAIRTFPLTWFVVKLRTVYELIRPSRTFGWFYWGIHQNSLGLEQNSLCGAIRAGLRIRMLTIQDHALLRWFSGVHLVWIVVNVVSLGYCGLLYFKHKQGAFLFWTMLLSILASYYSSYVLATTAWDFRLMYPSTLSMQVTVIAYLLSKCYSHHLQVDLPVKTPEISRRARVAEKDG